jgi:lipopolysaccharide transport system ATP-binding protein
MLRRAHGLDSKNPEAMIEVHSLGKCYSLGAGRRIQVHEAIERVVRRSVGLQNDTVREPFWALRGCSFKVQKGEVVGILGHNGAGKSILLKMLSRVVEPTEGHAVLRGRVASILELGAGFDPDMTGRENILFNGAILGVSQVKMSARMSDIISFAELERFIDEPTKTYSSGMYARLAFSVASHVEADVLLLDEVLAVGDAAFSRRCIARLEAAAGLAPQYCL